MTFAEFRYLQVLLLLSESERISHMLSHLNAARSKESSMETELLGSMATLT